MFAAAGSVPITISTNAMHGTDKYFFGITNTFKTGNGGIPHAAKCLRRTRVPPTKWIFMSFFFDDGYNEVLPFLGAGAASDIREVG
jgi:hypothetical protein